MKRKMLFGGALFCAGLHSVTTEAQVSDASFRFATTVTNVFEIGPPYPPPYQNYNTYVDTGVNQGFDVSGDASLLPFGQTARGGVLDAYGLSFLSTYARTDGSGSLSPQGELSFQGLSIAQNSLRFPDDPPPVTPNSAQGVVTFTVDTPSEYRLEVTMFDVDNDFGSGGVTLYDVAGVDIFEYFNSFNPAASEGVLEPGTYTLSYFASSQGSASVELLVVPAPATTGLLALGATAVLRRRR